MIFETLYEHAKVLSEKGYVGEKTFVLDKARVDINELRERIRKSEDEKKVTIPLVFHGVIETHSISRLKRSNAGNASNNTFKKKKIDDLPPEWFPWVNNNSTFHSEELLKLMQKINEAPWQDLESLFTKGGSLSTFDKFQENELEEKVAKTICLPVYCKSPKVFSHLILGLNALYNESSAEEIGQFKMNEELWRFALLFWVLDKAKNALTFIAEDEKKLQIGDVSVAGGGTVGSNIDNLPLLSRSGELILGAKIDKLPESPFLLRWAKLATEDDPETVTLGKKVYSASSTGKSPTNAWKNGKGENALQDFLRKGFPIEKVLPILDGYTPLVKDTSFRLDDNLYYYIFPEVSVPINDYLEYLRSVIRDIRDHKNEYYNSLKIKNNKKEEKMMEALKRINGVHRDFWDNLQDSFQINSLSFSFEENVASANQSQYAWTSVYHGQSVQRVFLLLFLLNMPDEFGVVSKMLKDTSQDMGANWTGREKRYLIDNFMCRRNLDTNEYWLRWRKYLTRKDFNENSFQPDVWERSIALIIDLKTIEFIEDKVLPEWNGNRLFEEFDRGRSKMKENRKDEIYDYLKHLFIHDEITHDEKKERITSMLKRCAEEYAVFVDTDSEHWKSIVQGLICGWGLNRVCYKLRKEDPRSVIGGRSLIKRQPEEVRTLMIDLIEKLARSGKRVWLIEQPTEILFNWAERNTADKEVRLFMDALAFGFFRYNQFSAKADVEE